jgi:hypothetical protein
MIRVECGNSLPMTAYSIPDHPQLHTSSANSWASLSRPFFWVFEKAGTHGGRRIAPGICVPILPIRLVHRNDAVESTQT